MPMSFAGRVASSSGCVCRRKGRGTGWRGFDAPRQLSSPTGVYGTAAAKHREPRESRGSRTVHRATIPLAVRPTERGDGNEPAASPALKAAGV